MRMDIKSASGYLQLYQTLIQSAFASESGSTGLSPLLSPSFATMLEAIMKQAANVQEPIPQTSSTPFTASTIHPLMTAFSPLYSSGKEEAIHTAYTEAQNLNQHLKGALQGAADLFTEAGKTYGINPALLAAISMHETGNGNSRAVQLKNNPGGMMGRDGLKTYSSLKEGIFDMARNLRKNYLDQGISTIAEIGAKYAPIGASNDPYHLNNYWVKGVQSYFNLLTKQGPQ
jgi:hypothetical protein